MRVHDRIKKRAPTPRKILAVLIVASLLLAGGAIALSDGTVVTGTVPLNATDGPEVLLETPTSTETDLDLKTAFPDSNTVDVTHDDGNATFSSTGPSGVTVQSSDLEGTYTSLSAIDGTNDLTINPADKQRVTVGGGIDTIAFRDASVDDGTAEFGYSASSTATLTLQNVGIEDRQIVAVADDGTQVGFTTTSSTGTARFDNLQSGNYNDVTLQTSSPPSTSNPSPVDGSGAPESPVELAIDVDDDDFGTSFGDTVDVTFEAKYQGDSSYSTVGTSTISSAGRVNASYTPNTLGTHEWKVTAVDDQNNTVTRTFEFDTPNTITVKNESAPSQTIGSGVETTFRFFGSDEVYTRNSTDGTINMTGLPDEQFILELSTAGNYSDRTVVINSIFDQRTVYLLPDDALSVQSRFILNDPTGNFGPETELYIEKPLEVNGTTTYQTITADEFGAEGVSARLEKGSRYRLKIKSSGGITQLIGPYRATANETVEVTPGQPTIGVGESSDSWSTNTNIDNTTLEYRYDDPEQLTDKVTVSIYERGDESNKLVPDETYFDLGTASAQVELDENETDTEWVVEFEITRDDETFSVTAPASGQRDLIPTLDPMWTTFGAIGLLFMSAGAFSVLNAGAGAVVISIQGAVLWWIGWLEGATAGAAVAIALFISVLVALWKSAGS